MPQAIFRLSKPGELCPAPAFWAGRPKPQVATWERSMPTTVNPVNPALSVRFDSLLGTSVDTLRAAFPVGAPAVASWIVSHTPVGCLNFLFLKKKSIYTEK